MLRKHKPILLHADWSKDPQRRALAVAVPNGRSWHVEWLVSPVTDDGLLKLLAEVPRPAVLGMDLPLGVPEAYARKLGLEAFPDLLAMLDRPAFSDFGQPARTPDEIDLYRPFYPQAPGGTLRTHLSERLDIPISNLYRRCEGSTAYRSQASPLFWTNGPQQVGKAALNAWYDVVRPAMGAHAAVLWPFAGDMTALVAEGRLVIAETYPTDVRRRLAPELNGLAMAHAGNRRQVVGAVREQVPPLRLGAGIEAEAGQGFATADRFDAFIGLLGMIWLAEAGWRPEAPQEDRLRVEGWMLGLDPAVLG